MNRRMLIWFAIVNSTVIYFILAFTMGGQPGDFDQNARSPNVLVLYALALAAFVAGWLIVPRIVTGDAQTRMIVALAVFEACAILGLVAAFLTSDWRVYVGPWALALLGFIREFPRESSRTAP